MNIFISRDGTIQAIYAETIDFRTLGNPKIERASHVEPDQSGNWFAEIINGPRLGPFARRSDALAAEVNWLIEHRLTPNQETCDLAIHAEIPL